MTWRDHRCVSYAKYVWYLQGLKVEVEWWCAGGADVVSKTCEETGDAPFVPLWYYLSNILWAKPLISYELCHRSPLEMKYVTA